MKFKITASSKKTAKSKAITYGYKVHKCSKMKDFIYLVNTQATVPCELTKGHRQYDNVTKIFNIVRFDVDKEGESEILEKALKKYYYIKKPSTNHHKAPYKWHYLVFTKNANNDPMKYKYQVQMMCKDLGIELQDMRVTFVVVQNMNPYRDGAYPEEAVKVTTVHEGKLYKLTTKIPDEITYSAKSKITVSSKGLARKPKNAVKIKNEDDYTVELEQDSMIKTQNGWVEVGKLEIKQNELLGNLGCPVCNENHSDGKNGDLGYAFAYRRSNSEIIIQCSGANCACYEYIVRSEVLLYDEHDVVDLEKATQYIKNTGYQPTKNMYMWLDENGVTREFRSSDIAVFFTNILKKDVKLTDILSLDTKKTLSVQDYLKIMYTRMLNTIKRYHQYERINYTVNPFRKNEVNFSAKTMCINLNTVLPIVPERVEDNIIVLDFKEHFPQLDDYLRLITANRFGADRKTAYIWWRCDSNWGKSFFFNAVLGSLGIVVNTKENEIKMALKGSPSGLSADMFLNAWILFVDEFKGAVSELKDITHTLSFSSKGKQKTEVELFTKQFASAENVESLNGTYGMEAQFANRFSIWEMHGKLTKRTAYKVNMEHYKKVLVSYCYQFLRKEVDMYLELGELRAPVKAQGIASTINKRYAITNIADSMDYLGKRVKELYQEVVVNINNEEWKNSKPYAQYFIIKDGNLWMHNITKCKEDFLSNSFSKYEIANFSHKTPKEIFGIMKNSKSKRMKVKGVTKECFYIGKVRELKKQNNL